MAWSSASLIPSPAWGRAGSNQQTDPVKNKVLDAPQNRRDHGISLTLCKGEAPNRRELWVKEQPGLSLSTSILLFSGRKPHWQVLGVNASSHWSPHRMPRGLGVRWPGLPEHRGVATGSNTQVLRPPSRGVGLGRPDGLCECCPGHAGRPRTNTSSTEGRASRRRGWNPHELSSAPGVLVQNART